MVSGHMHSSWTVTLWITGMKASLRSGVYLWRLKKLKIDDWTFFLIKRRSWYPQILDLSAMEGYRRIQLQVCYLEIFLSEIHREAWSIGEWRRCVSTCLMIYIRSNYWQGEWIFKIRRYLHPKKWASQSTRIRIGCRFSSDFKLETNRATSFPSVVNWSHSGPGGTGHFMCPIITSFGLLMSTS